MLTVYFREQLVGGYGIAESTAVCRDIRPGEPDLVAVVMFAQHVGVVQSADRSDLVTVTFQSCQWCWQCVPAARLLNLPGERVDSVGDIDEYAAFWSCLGFLFGPQWTHAVQQRQRNGNTCTAENMSAIDQPAGSIHVRHGVAFCRVEWAVGSRQWAVE